MLSTATRKLQFLYKPYALAIVSVGYVLGELGHYLIGKRCAFDSARLYFLFLKSPLDYARKLAYSSNYVRHTPISISTRAFSLERESRDQKICCFTIGNYNV